VAGHLLLLHRTLRASTWLAGKKARSALYHNNHDGTFTDVTKQAGLSDDSKWATGAAFADYDGDAGMTCLSHP
jgi:hypothetical protein